MKKAARKTTKKEEQNQPNVATMDGLCQIVRRELREFVVEAGLAALYRILEEERTMACGPRYIHDPKRKASRAGHVDGGLILGGRRLTVRRPRARTRTAEVALPTWEAFSREDPLNDRALQQMAVGVATRKYARSLEPLGRVGRERGTSKSAVSRRFVAQTTEQLGELMQRSLSDLNLRVLMVDGIHFAEHVMLVALGIDSDGRKHVLGLHEGATENASACTALLTNLRERGMRTDRAMLVVIDGAKALRKAVVDVLGARSQIQRCQVHKLRNVEDHLPAHAAQNAKSVMRKAYRSGDVDHARQRSIRVLPIPSRTGSRRRSLRSCPARPFRSRS